MLFLRLYAYSLLVGGPMLAHYCATRRRTWELWQVTIFCAAGGATAGIAVIATLLLTELSSFHTLGPEALPFIGRYALVGLGIGLISVLVPKSVRPRVAEYCATLPWEIWLHRREVVLATLCSMLIQVGGASVYERLTAAPSPYVHVDAPAHATRTARLPDESQVVLAPGAQLSYTSWFAPHDERELTLNGEGTFTVARGARGPLTLTAAGAEVRASDARFTVHAYAGEPIAYVIVKEGRVEVRARTLNDSSRILTLHGGEGARVGPRLAIARSDSEFHLQR